MQVQQQNSPSRLGRIDGAAVAAALLVFACAGIAGIFAFRLKSQARVAEVQLVQAMEASADARALQLESTSVSMPQQTGSQFRNQIGGVTQQLPAKNASQPGVTQQAQQNSASTTVVRPVVETQYVPSDDNPSVLVPRQTVRYQTEVRPATSTLSRATSPVTAWQQYSPAIDPQTMNEVGSLLRKLKSQPAEDRSEEDLKSLEELVARQFESQHQAQVKRLKRILDQASKTQQVLETRNERKDEIIQRRVIELLGENDPLNWDYQVPNNLVPSQPPRYGTSSFGATQSNSQGYAPNYSSSSLRPIPSNSQTSNANVVNQQAYNTPRFNSTQPSRSQPQGQQPQRTKTPNEAFNDWLSGQNRNNQVAYGQGTRSTSRGQQQSSPNSDSLAARPAKSGTSTGGGNPLLTTRPQTFGAVTGGSSPEIVNDSLVNIAHRCRRAVDELKNVEKLYQRKFVNKSQYDNAKSKVEELRDVWSFQKETLEQELLLAEVELKSAIEQYESANVRHSQGVLSSDEYLKSKVNRTRAEAKFSVAASKMNWVKKYEKNSAYGLIRPETDAAESDISTEEADRTDTSDALSTVDLPDVDSEAENESIFEASDLEDDDSSTQSARGGR